MPADRRKHGPNRDFSIAISSARQHTVPLTSAVQRLLMAATEERVMSLVRLLGFRTLGCGCVIGEYRELATRRELTYVEEKGIECHLYAHRRNHTVSITREASAAQLTARAS